MPTALRIFERMQIGRETVPGTPVPATRQLIGDVTVNEARNIYTSPYPGGVRATSGGRGVTTQRSAEISVAETELNTRELLWPLLIGVRGGVTPTPGEVGDETAQTWVFTPQVDDYPDIDTATVEFVRSDGTTNHIAIEAAHVMASSIGLNFAASEIATMSWDGFGRAAVDAAPTAAILPYLDRQPLVSNFTGVYVDDAWGDIGTTQLIGVMAGATINITTGLAPVYKMDQRETLDFSHFNPGTVAADVTLRMQLQESAAGEYGHWRANDLRYIRVVSQGELIAGAATARHSVQFDAAMRFSATPTFTDQDGETIMEMTGQVVIDPGTTNFFVVTVINDLEEAGL